MIAIGSTMRKDDAMCLVFLKEMLSQWNLSDDDLLSTLEQSVLCRSPAQRRCSPKERWRGPREGLHRMDPPRHRQNPVLHLRRPLQALAAGGPRRRQRHLLTRKGAVRHGPHKVRIFYIDQVAVPMNYLAVITGITEEARAKAPLPGSLSQHADQVRGKPGRRIRAGRP